jgi:hypothetical protein
VRTAPVHASGRTGSTGKFPPVLRNPASPDRRQPIGVKDHATNQCLLAARRHHVTPGGTGRQKGRGWGRGGRPENTKETIRSRSYLSAHRSHSNGRHRLFPLLRRLFRLRFYTVRFAVRHTLPPSLLFDAHTPMVAVGTFFLPRAPPPPTLAATSDARR